MGRKYKPDPTKKRYKKYDPNVLKEAVLEYLNTKKLIEVAAKYGIHPSVLYRHSNKTMKSQGGQTALTPEIEDILIENINTCAEWGYPFDKMDLRFLVKMFLDKLKISHKRFKNNMPGPDWAENFLERHRAKISERLAENIKRVRAAVSSETITKYFNELRATLADVPPCNIINYDETNLTDDPGRRKVLVKRGCKYPERIMNSTKTSISIMMAGTADGHMLPPYVVYKSTHLYDTWLQGGPEGTLFNRSSSGWFEGAIFEDWVKKMVIPYFHEKTGSKYLIGDNLSSHLSIDLVKLCKEHNVNFIFLPPNSTHLTQPLDVAFFRPMKIAWRNLLMKWKKSDGRFSATVPKSCFPKLLKLLIEELKKNSTENILAGFRKTGISPLNLQEILNRLPGQNGEDLDSDEAKKVISDSVLDLLKDMRYGSMNVIENKRKRKLNVIAGCSVNAEEIGNHIDEVNNEQTEKKKQKKDGKTKPKISKKGKGIGKKTKTLTGKNSGSNAKINPNEKETSTEHVLNLDLISERDIISNTTETLNEESSYKASITHLEDKRTTPVNLEQDLDINSLPLYFLDDTEISESVIVENLYDYPSNKNVLIDDGIFPSTSAMTENADAKVNNKKDSSLLSVKQSQEKPTTKGPKIKILHTENFNESKQMISFGKINFKKCKPLEMSHKILPNKRNCRIHSNIENEILNLIRDDEDEDLQ